MNRSLNVLWLIMIGSLIQFSISAQSGTNSTPQTSFFNSNELFIGPETFNISSLDHQINRLRGTYIKTYVGIESSYRKIKGSPYIYDDFKRATIILNNGSRIEDVAINYDGFVNQIIAKNEENKIILNPKYISEVIVDDYETYAIFGKPDHENPDRFYQILYDKKGIVFFKDPGIKYHEEKTNGIFETPARFSKLYRYYISKENNEVVSVNLRKKDIFQHFPQIEVVAMEEIIKKKKFKMKKESDYVALFAQL